MYIANPTAVGTSYILFEDILSINSANESIVNPLGTLLSSRKLGTEHIVPLLVSGVTVPICGYL